MPSFWVEHSAKASPCGANAKRHFSQRNLEFEWFDVCWFVGFWQKAVKLVFCGLFSGYLTGLWVSLALGFGVSQVVFLL